MQKPILALILFLCAACSERSGESQPPEPGAAAKSVLLKLDPSVTQHMTITETSPGVYDIVTTGSDPWVKCVELEEPFDPAELSRFAFDYFCPDGIDDFTVYFGNEGTVAPNASAGRLPRAETWVAASVDMSAKSFGKWKNPITTLRIDPGTRSGVRFQIRNIRLRPADAQEAKSSAELQAERDAKDQRAAKLEEYLGKDYPAKVREAVVTEDKVRISGSLPPDSEGLSLIEVRIHEEPWMQLPGHTTPVEVNVDGKFDQIVERFDGNHDRLLSRWAVVRMTDDGSHELLSHAVFPTDVSSLAPKDIPYPKTRTKKGMGGIEYREITPELAELGIEHVTINIILQDLVMLRPGKGSIAHEYNGETFHMRRSETEGYDRTIKFATDHDMVVSLIILTGFPGDPELRKILIHPESTKPGIYGMPNLTNAEGAKLYAAGLDFLASRYADPESPHGLASNWIMHNEVDYAWTWSNMGMQPMALFMDTHVRSMRMAHLIARKHNPHARTFLSLTHSWNKTGPAGNSYVPRSMVDRLADYSRSEGDFEWGLAYHPYPQSLFKPATWNDTMATFSFDTPMITLKNIEVLDAYMRKPSMLYRGEKTRGVLLSEQGYHTEGYGDKAQQLQAAAFVYTWHKIRPLKSIEAFQNHRWVDHPDEGGLKLGVRTIPDKKHPSGRKKFSWTVLKALDTPQEAAATEFAKPIIGVKDFSEIPYKGEIR
ncbi:DUF5722 domain-containing protein [Haloferula sp.]|uniref:DUF5722 domain-containing protein n=1 Tax=Haloferula sp. TaxID=2497595 RepID=UPI00329C12BC